MTVPRSLFAEQVAAYPREAVRVADRRQALLVAEDWLYALRASGTTARIHVGEHTVTADFGGPDPCSVYTYWSDAWKPEWADGGEQHG